VKCGDRTCEHGFPKPTPLMGWGNLPITKKTFMLFMSVLYYTKYRVLVFFLKTHNNDEI
jgi:hypothetical protein